MTQMSEVALLGQCEHVLYKWTSEYSLQPWNNCWNDLCYFVQLLLAQMLNTFKVKLEVWEIPGMAAIVDYCNDF